MGGHAVIRNDNLVMLHPMLTLSDFSVEFAFPFGAQNSCVHMQIYLNVSIDTKSVDVL